VIVTFATGEERATYRPYDSLDQCQQHALALRREAARTRQKVRTECRYEI